MGRQMNAHKVERNAFIQGTLTIYTETQHCLQLLKFCREQTSCKTIDLQFYAPGKQVDPDQQTSVNKGMNETGCMLCKCITSHTGWFGMQTASKLHLRLLLTLGCSAKLLNKVQSLCTGVGTLPHSSTS